MSLADIVARDAHSDAAIRQGAVNAGDRRELLALLRETRDALEEATTWPGGGTLHHAQANWRKTLNRLAALDEPTP
jgi:hypothetical protein